MDGDEMLIVLWKGLDTRRRLSIQIKELQKRICVEIMRAEWKRLVRTRHYITCDCLKKPEDSDWMDIWTRRLEKNMLNMTSLSSFVNYRFR
ncbi:hypothetical protein L917_19565 [Phytophthora nicotianae]|uniref:Uncharacterized protein n=1 Tax=Phytophthora nicotianae TaxID=4792 RepID=W2K5N7_PHYNI|nr:hypothetical protein L917_19565 [Phytophthora nicotianae]